MPISATDLVLKIIAAQEPIIGPLAWQVAGQVKGLAIKDHRVAVKGQGPQVIQGLVEAYENMFGPASREVSRDALRSFGTKIDKTLLPAGLV